MPACGISAASVHNKVQARNKMHPRGEDGIHSYQTALFRVQRLRASHLLVCAAVSGLLIFLCATHHISFKTPLEPKHAFSAFPRVACVSESLFLASSLSVTHRKRGTPAGSAMTGLRKPKGNAFCVCCCFSPPYPSTVKHAPRPLRLHDR